MLWPLLRLVEGKGVSVFVASSPKNLVHSTTTATTTISVQDI
jgi:hypothetical protein